MKVECAKAEMEMKIYEAQENIKRLQDNIEHQASKMASLREEINELKQ